MRSCETTTAIEGVELGHMHDWLHYLLVCANLESAWKYVEGVDMRVIRSRREHMEVSIGLRSKHTKVSYKDSALLFLVNAFDCLLAGDVHL